MGHVGTGGAGDPNPQPPPPTRAARAPGTGMTPEAAASPSRETLFRRDAAAGVTFRIPALLYVPRTATLLAFAEKRAGARDEDAEHLVLRRGRCRGHAVEWGPLEELPQLRLPGHRAMNPCPVYEAAGGTVLLLCICVRGRVSERRQLLAGRSAARLCCAASADGGRSWAPLRDLTAQALGPELRRWATFAVGPGHGVQLAAGRLAVPAYAYRVRRRLCGRPLPCCTRPHALVVYSDNRGRSWSRGALVEGPGTGECQVAEVAAGDGGSVLYCSARPRRMRCRAVALSTDRGLRFGRSGPCEELCEPPRGCQGSVVSFAPERPGEGGNTDKASKDEGDDTKGNGAVAGDAIANGVTTSNAKANNVTNNTKASDAIANNVITNDAIANKANDDEVNDIKTNNAFASDAVTNNVKANNVKANGANATVADSASTNDAKANDAEVNDGNVNDAKANDAKVNDDDINNVNPNAAKADNAKANAAKADANAASWLLFSHPTDKHRRRDLGVYVNPSPLSGSSWWPPWLLYRGPCGYSDLAVLPGGLFGCLFECGGPSGCEEIAFCLFSQRQLLGACGQPSTH